MKRRGYPRPDTLVVLLKQKMDLTYLKDEGWYVLRYSTKQLQNPQECLNQIKKAINQLGGLMRTEQTNWFEIQNSNGTTQLEIFNKSLSDLGKKNR